MLMCLVLTLQGVSAGVWCGEACACEHLDADVPGASLVAGKYGCVCVCVSDRPDADVPGV